MLNAVKDKIQAIYAEVVCQIKRWQHRKKLPPLSSRDRVIIDALKKDGVYVTTLAELGLNSTSDLLQAAYYQLSRMQAANNEHQGQKWPQISTVTGLAEFSAWGQEQRLVNIIENYIGLPVKFHGVHLRKDFPSNNQFGTLLWHSDAEDRRIIKIFVYLNDVDETTGPFEYIPRSLTPAIGWKTFWLYYKLWQSNYMGINDEQVKKFIPKSAWKSCKGQAGTVIFADTKNTLHHGTVRSVDRAALFFCYTANPPERPELCTQYWDDTFPRAELTISPELSLHKSPV